MQGTLTDIYRLPRVRSRYFFKAVCVKAQRSAVFGDVADQLVAGTLGNFGMDFEGDFDAGTDDGGEMLNDFFRDTGSIATHADRIDADRAVKTSNPRL